MRGSNRSGLLKRSDIVVLALVSLILAGIGGLGIVSNRIKFKSPRPAVSQPQRGDQAPNASR
jgi:hypothetical protein